MGFRIYKGSAGKTRVRVVSAGISMEEDGLDFVLSQALDIAETEESLNEMNLTQTFNVCKEDSEDVPNFSLLEEFEIGGNIKLENTLRFGPPLSEDDIDTIKQSFESKNTRKNTNWSITTFQEWRKHRMEITGAFIPDLVEMNEIEMNEWMTRFVLEARRKDGAPYPPRSLYQLCVGLLRYNREKGNDSNFLDEKNLNFMGFRRALSAKMSELTAQGIGTVKKQAEPVSEKEEKILWEKNVLGNSTSKSLLYSVFFYNCKLFGLRGVDEHRNLSIGQFELHDMNDGERPYIVFRGRSSKTYKGKLNLLMYNPIMQGLIFNKVGGGCKNVF